MKRVVLGIDIGTGTTKGMAVTSDGVIHARAKVGHPTHYGPNGEAEQNPFDWLHGCGQVTRRMLDGSEVVARDVEAVAFSGQIRTLVTADAAGDPLRPAMLWFDPRALEEGEAVRRRSFSHGGANPNPLTAHTSAAKLLWLRSNEPDHFSAIRQVLSPKDFVKLHLSGAAITDPSDASGTGLLNIPVRRWSRPLIEALGFDPGWFPPIEESTVQAGRLNRRGAELLGLAEGTPIIQGAADNACAAVGSGVIDGTTGLCSLGSSGLALVGIRHPPERVPAGIEVFCHAVPARWCAFGLLLSGGRSLEWAADRLFSREPGAESMQAELERSFEVDYARRPPIFLPYLDGGSAPGEETPPTAALVGLRAADSPTDMLRAVIQGVAFGLRDIFESLGPTATPITQVQLAGPLATHDSWCQLMADVLGIPTARTQIADTTELGAAMIGAVGVGMWDSIDSAANGMLRLSSEFQPRGEAVEFHADTFRRFQSIRSALGLGASRRLGQDVRIGPTREVP